MDVHGSFTALELRNFAIETTLDVDVCVKLLG